jgi:hypothetical protein
MLTDINPKLPMRDKILRDNFTQISWVLKNLEYTVVTLMVI